MQISGKPAYILLAYTGRVGEDTPVYLTWQADAPLFEKGEQGMVAGSRKTKISGIVTLAKVPGVDAAGTALSDNKDAAYYQIYQEGGWLPAVSVQKISQYALGELGFATLDKAPASFDLIDGINQPNNVVKGILEQLYKAAQEETRTPHALNKYNYKRLLELIDSNQDGYYSEQEYLQANHNVSYRDHLYRVIAKHASEWYYGKDDQLWKTYLEVFLDKMTWMKAASENGVALGAEPWHMHPIAFLNAIKKGKAKITREMLRRIWPDPRQYDPVLNEPMAVSAETHGDFWEDDMDYSEAVSYEGINTKAGVQAKTDEKTCENCPPEGKVMPMVRRCSRWSMVTISSNMAIRSA
ncbi:hypothetical protein ACTL4O_000210 [Salmonella enterica]